MGCGCWRGGGGGGLLRDGHVGGGAGVPGGEDLRVRRQDVETGQAAIAAEGVVVTAVGRVGAGDVGAGYEVCPARVLVCGAVVCVSD